MTPFILSFAASSSPCSLVMAGWRCGTPQKHCLKATVLRATLWVPESTSKLTVTFVNINASPNIQNQLSAPNSRGGESLKNVGSFFSG